MNLRRWDIVCLKVDEKDAVGHPAVILSGENALTDAKQHRMNVLVGTKKPPAAGTGEHLRRSSTTSASTASSLCRGNVCGR